MGGSCCEREELVTSTLGLPFNPRQHGPRGADGMGQAGAHRCLWPLGLYLSWSELKCSLTHLEVFTGSSTLSTKEPVGQRLRMRM